MTRILEDDATRTGDSSRAGRRRRPTATFRPDRWLPALLLLVWTSACLSVSGVAVRDTLVFVAYVVVGLSLPGTLVWRMLIARGRRPWIEDVVLGTILAFAFELVAYLLARAVGLPRLAFAWVLVVAVVAAMHPRRRQLWRPAETTAAPIWWSWLVALVLAFLVGWCLRNSWLPTPVEGGGLRYLYPDLPFHLALITDLRHHAPADFAYVAGQPLQYHWFGHAQMAASSWATGIDPVVLLVRLSPLLALVLGAVGAAVVARRIGGGWAGAGVTVAVLALIGNLSNNQNLFLNANSYLSPTQTFGAACLVVVLASGVHLLRAERPVGGAWAVFVIGALLLSGAKATFVPVALAGCAFVVVVRLLVARRLDVRAAVMTVVLGVSLLLASIFVYGGSAPGLRFAPLQSAFDNIASLGLGERTGLGWALLAMAGYLVPRLGAVVAIVGLRRRLVDDPAAIMLVGAVLGAAGATYTFAHQDFSQFYFLMSGAVPAAVLCGWGSRWLVQDASTGVRRCGLVAAVGGLVVGTALSWATIQRQLAGEPVGLWPLAPTVVMVAVLALGLVLVAVTPWRRAGRAAASGAVALLLVATSLGMGVGQAAATTLLVAQDPTATRWTPALKRGGPNLAPGGLQVAAWIRDNTDPDDVLATNAHCRVATSKGEECDRRAFSMAAFSERRFIVEGWAYTPPNAARASRIGDDACCTSFWDPDRLAVNDAVFDVPSREDLLRLQREEGVRWLVVNTRLDSDWEPLRELAQERYSRGSYVVLELPAPGSPDA